jgi:hypothetical protein
MGRLLGFGILNSLDPRVRMFANLRQHIEIEFPADPCDSGARFRLRVGPAHPLHSINNAQVAGLVAEAGEELVGLCYFGDQHSRETIEAQLALKGSTTDS